MKIVGFILISFGVVLLIFFLYNFIQEKNRIISPIPDEKGVKVLFISPSAK
jgi:hypothetical protein